PRRLRLCGERHGEEAASERANERSPVYHSMTWSARWSSDGGIVRPRAFAVLRLMTSSKLLGCSTGTSQGLAPFRILSTNEAARCQTATRSGAYDMSPPASTFCLNECIDGSRYLAARVARC